MCTSLCIEQRCVYKCLKHEGNKMLHHNIDHQIAFINFTNAGSSLCVTSSCKFLSSLLVIPQEVPLLERTGCVRTCLCPELIKLQDKVKRLFLIESKTK